MKKTLIALALSHILGAALLIGADQPSTCPKAAASGKTPACCAGEKAKACCKETKACCEKTTACDKETKACAEKAKACDKTAACAAKANDCPVSGEKLGSMGEPYSYTYKEAGQPDRTILLCCKMCVKAFEKNPAKYLAKLDAGQE